MRATAFLASLVLGAGCSEPAPSAPPAPSTSAATGALAAEPAPLALPTLPTLPALGPGARLLDVEGDRVLAGVPDEAPANADPVMRMEVRLWQGGVPQAWPAEAQPAAHARLLPGGRALAVTPRGALLLVDGSGASGPAGSVRALDEQVVGPVGASPDGARIAYCKGEAPDVEVWRLDLLAGARPVRVTADLAPAWSPGVADDGSVLVASARSGVAALWRVDRDAAPIQLTNRDAVVAPGAPPLAPFPASLTPTLFDGDRAVFEGEDGVVVTDREGRVLRKLPGASVPHWRPGRRAAAVTGSLVEVDLARVGGAP